MTLRADLSAMRRWRRTAIGMAFLMQVDERRSVLSKQFEAIDALRPMPGYNECVAEARAFLGSL